MSQFKKGNSGRPKGTKDHSWNRLSFWFELLKTELNKEIIITVTRKDGTFVETYKTTAVDPNKRAQIFLDAMKMLVNKMKALPADPEDSLFNAEEAMASLKQIESSIKAKEKSVTSDKLPPCP